MRYKQAEVLVKNAKLTTSLTNVLPLTDFARLPRAKVCNSCFGPAFYGAKAKDSTL
jgi:hypothetical protein